MKNIFLSLVALFLCISLSSCVEDDVYQGPATIVSVGYTPSSVTPDDQVTVTATVEDLQGITSAKILYTVNGGPQQEAVMAGTSNTYTGNIPQQENTAVVNFTVSVTNVAGFTTASSQYSYTVGVIPPDYTQLILNEIDGNSKAVELYNAGIKPIPLDGITLIKNNSTVWWTGTAAAGKILAGSYILIIQDNTDPVFSGAGGISNKQNLKFELKDPSGNSIGLFLRGDESNLGGTISNVSPNSFQRIPNATGEWKMADPTNGAQNASSGTDIPQN